MTDTRRTGFSNKKKKNTNTGILVAGLTLVTLTGCQTIEETFQKDSPDYRTATTLPPLEVPPGLKRKGGKGTLSVPTGSGNESTTLSGYQSQNQGVSAADLNTGVLPTFDNMKMMRSGDERWLVVDGAAEDLWPRVTDFWLKDRIRLVVENPGTGVMETDWLENYAEINTVARRWFRKVLGSIVTADSYDKFRVRIENGQQPGTTEVYMTHRGISADELPKENAKDVISTRWVSTQTDPELEVEMLRLLMMHLGLEEAQAEQVVASAAAARPERAVIDGTQIVVSDNASDTWRRVGLALDRLGFTVEDQNRQTGTYFVRTVDPEAAANRANRSWVSNLLRRGNKNQVEFKSRVQIADLGGKASVTVRNESGDVDNTDAGQRILGLLLDELK